MPRNSTGSLRATALVLIASACLIEVRAAAPETLPAFRLTGRTWLFLTPETLSLEELNDRLESAAAELTPRARARRIKSLGWPPVRACDLPPSAERLLAVEATGCRVIRTLRYVNAVVVEGNPLSVARASRLPFVKSIEPVRAFASSTMDGGLTVSNLEGGLAVANLEGGLSVRSLLEEFGSNAQERLEMTPLSKREFEIADEADYGQSLAQLKMVNVIAAHEEGFHGEGVLIGVQDTGFEFRRHAGYRYIDVIATYDFLNGDPNVFDEDDQGSAQHGTRVLSVIAGLDSGYFIGVAPKAQFVLTKTENSDSETPIEEDIWVEGLWYHDSLGVDVLSSSLSYREWHEYEDYDGRTAVTSLAADSAAAAGIVLVNSMGNTGLWNYPRSKMGAPADARGVISVGGVTRDSSRWASSSQGPTYDGRIKPNVVAQSSQVYTVSTSDNSTYAARSGTSYSAPTVAGIVALMIQANPGLTQPEVMDILQRTSSQAESPDTLSGYGIVNALAAVRAARDLEISETIPPNSHTFFELYPNPANGRAIIFSNGLRVSNLELRDISGRLMAEDLQDRSLDLSKFPAGSYLVGSQRSGWQRLVLLK